MASGSGASGTSSYRRFLSTNQLRQVSPLDAVVEDPVNPGNTRRVKVRPPPPPYPTQSPSEEGERVDRLHGASPSDSKRHIQRARHDPQRRNTVIMRGREHGIGCTEAGIDWDQVSTANGPRPRIFMVRNDSRPGRATAPAARKPNKVDKRTEVDMLTDYLVMLSNPSKAERNGMQSKYVSSTPLKDGVHYHRTWLQVYEEGFGGCAGCARHHWLQHFVKETVEFSDDGESETNNGSERTVRIWRTPDNQVFHNLQLRVREFFDLGGYRAFPDVVTLELKIREILEVDASEGKFRIIFIMTTRWYDPHFDTGHYLEKKGQSVFARSIPYLTLDGVDEGSDPVGVPPDAAGLSQSEKHCGMVTLQKGADPPGVLYHSQRLQCTFVDKNDSLLLFPFDKQMLDFTIRMWGACESRDVDEGRVLLPLNISMELMTGHPEFITMSAETQSLRPRNNRQELAIRMPLRRRPMYFIFNVMVIIGLLTTMCFAVFRISNSPEDYANKCQITLTLLLTIVAYKFFVGDMFPRAAYLTVLDYYIYASIAVASGIFLLNSRTVCYGGTGECVAEDDADVLGYWILSNFWIATNISVFSMAGIYVYRVYHKERHLHSFSDAEPVNLRRKKDRTAEVISIAKSKEKFFSPEEDTVVKRRKAALKKFKAIEEEQAEFADVEETIKSELANCKDRNERKKLQRQLAEHRKNPNLLPLYDPKLARVGASATSRQRQYQAEKSVVDPATGIPGLLTRAGLVGEIPLLAPVLDDAGLTEDELRNLFNDGSGIGALNQLLEDAGIVEACHRIAITTALNGGGHRMRTMRAHLDGTASGTSFLVLQGAASDLWASDLGLDHQEPIKHNDLLRKIGDKLASAKSVSPMGFDELRITANCLLGRLLLSSPLLGRATYVYAKGHNDPSNQNSKTWAGYLERTEGKFWKKVQGDALAIEIGTEKTIRGFARYNTQSKDMIYTEVDAPDRSEIGRMLTKSAVYAHPYLMNDCTSAHRGVPSVAALQEHLQSMGIVDEESKNEAERSQTDRMFELCEEICNVYIKDAVEKNPSIKYILLFGTAELRKRVQFLEIYCGAIVTEQLHAVAEFCEELWAMRERENNRSPTGIKIHFEILGADEEALCSHAAAKDGLSRLEHEGKRMLQKLLQSLRDDATESFSTVSWNDGLDSDGHCQGVVGTDIFDVPVGLKTVMTRLVHQAALQERAANVDTRRGSCGSLYGCDHYDESRACKVIKELQKGGACKLEFQDVDQALEVVNRQISSVLKELRYDLEPAHV